MSPHDNVNLNSTDAMFATVLGKLEQQKEQLDRIVDFCKTSNIRITDIEKKESWSTGWTVGVSTLVAGSIAVLDVAVRIMLRHP